MGVISGYSVDEHCIEAFVRAVEILKQDFGARKVTDFSEIFPGELIAQIPPRIKSVASKFCDIPVYKVKRVGNDFDEKGDLIMNESAGTDFLYFEPSYHYSIDLNRGFSIDGPSGMGSLFFCIEARDIGLLKEKYPDLEEDLRGILYKIPAERFK